MPGGFDLASGVGGVIQGISGIITGISQRKNAKKLQKQVDQERGQATGYANQVLDESKKSLSEANNLYQGRMPGASQAEQNIYGAQANTLSNFQRNATDASQLLALGGATQGATNDAFSNLSMSEAQDKQRRYGIKAAAQSGVRDAYGNLQDLYGRYSAMDQQAANQLGAASQQNTAGGIGALGEVGMVGAMGGYSGLFQGKQTPGMSGTPVNNINERMLQPFQFTAPPAVNFSLPNAGNIFSYLRK